MTKQFSGKKVLVTGGTRGIGESIAEAFLNEGAELLITGTQKNNSDQKYQFFAADFSDRAQLKQFIKEISSLKIDILINNAGINKIDPISQLDFSDWEKIQRVNVQAVAEISQAVLQNMKSNRWGRIINIASVFGIVSKAQRSAYTASKAAVIGLTKTMALDLAPDNILVNAVSPGFIDTDLTQKVLGPEGIREMVNKVPLKKLGTGKDVAEMVLFLAGEKNQFITGQNFIVDGGFTCE